MTGHLSRQQAPAPLNGAGAAAPEPGSEAPGTFIERYGLVQYTGRLGARYPREGACELGLCGIKRAQVEQWQAEAERLLQTRTLPARKAAAYEAALASIEAQRPGRGAVLVFDHCHRHGWVRGLICMACNNDLALFEPEPRSAWAANAAGTLLALVTAHLAKCPDCRRLRREGRGSRAYARA